MILSLIWTMIVSVLIVRAIGQKRSLALALPTIRPIGRLPSVAVVIPARNEADKIGRCLAGLLAQCYPASRFSVTVVDDGSGDATACIVEQFAERAANLRLLRGDPLPTGWLGKSYACWQGARKANAEWLCFLDADTCVAPEALAAAVGIAQRRQLDLLSLEPYQELESFWERLILPTGFLLLAFFKDLRPFSDPTSEAATANGQFILVRRATYEVLGGHAAIRGEIAEDRRLAERAKRSGHRIALMAGDQLVHTRMYTGLGPLWQGLSKHAVEIADGIAPLLLYAIAGFMLGIAALVLPAWGWLRLVNASLSVDGVLAAALATAGTLALLGIHAGTLRHFRIPPVYAILAPVSYLMILLIAANCVRQRVTGKTMWKGRVYALSKSSGRLRDGEHPGTRRVGSG